MLTKARLDQYIKDGQLVPIGTELMTVQGGKGVIVNNKESEMYPYKVKFQDSHTMGYTKDFKFVISNAYTSLIDPPPSSISNPFTREELERIKVAFKGEIISIGCELDEVIAAKANHLLTTPSEFPKMMEIDINPFGGCWEEKQVEFIQNNRAFVIVGKTDVSIKYESYSDFRPIPKEKTLADLKEGEFAYAIQEIIMKGGDKDGCKATEFGKKYKLKKYGNHYMFETNVSDEHHMGLYEDASQYFSYYPPTEQQIATAEAAEIQAVKDKYELMKKEVANGI